MPLSERHVGFVARQEMGFDDIDIPVRICVAGEAGFTISELDFHRMELCN